MKLHQDLKEAKAKRKSLKHQVERRRRERINRNLETLKTLLLQQQGETRRRVEKAEILERTVTFLHNSTSADQTTSEGGCQKHFQDGFSTCLQRAVKFLGPGGKGLWHGETLDASFAARFPFTDCAHKALSSSSLLILRNSYRSTLQMLMHSSRHRPCTNTLSLASGHLHGKSGPTTPRQSHKATEQVIKQIPARSHHSSPSLWRPWP